VVVNEQVELAFDLTGGALGVDFANTLDDRLTAQPIEYLGTYGDLLAFSRQTASLSAEALRALPSEARRRPLDAAAALTQAIEIRELIYRIYLAIATEARPSDGDLASLNRTLSAALGHACVRAQSDGYTWDWTDADRSLDAPLWPIVRAAADLLTSSDLRSLRVCASENCHWLFLDTSRNGSRRWCNMKTCGNRAKARRHHARVRAALTTAT
jgi:predicted RNA-binding Zn ribbon-like protein